MKYEIWAIPVPSDVQRVKIILILMILVSIKAYNEMNVWESLSLYQRLGLAGWQLTHGATLPELGQGCFCPRGT